MVRGILSGCPDLSDGEVISESILNADYMVEQSEFELMDRIS